LKTPYYKTAFKEKLLSLSEEMVLTLKKLVGFCPGGSELIITHQSPGETVQFQLI
jgi:hypothetical protein